MTVISNCLKKTSLDMQAVVVKSGCPEEPEEENTKYTQFQHMYDVIKRRTFL